MSVSKNVLDKIVSEIVGSCSSNEAIIEGYDLDIDSNELEDILNGVNVERCHICEWWCAAKLLMTTTMLWVVIRAGVIRNELQKISDFCVSQSIVSC